MNTIWMRPLAPLAALAIAACASTGGQPGTATSGARSSATAATGSIITPQLVPGSAELQSYRIDNWNALDDRTLIVESIDRHRYQAQFMGNCIGLRFVNTLAFITDGTRQLDRFSGVVLPDGTRCQFRSFHELLTPAQTAAGEKAADEARSTPR